MSNKNEYSSISHEVDRFCIKADTEIGVSTISDGVVLPLKEGAGLPRYGAGGVLDQSSQFVAVSGMGEEGYLQYGASYEYSKSQTEYSEESVIWFGLFFSHWGHFLMELVGRMWYLVDHYKGEKIIYISKRDEIEGNFIEFLSYLGVPKEKIIRIDKPTAFSEIIIPDYAGTEFYSSEKMVRLFQYLVANSGYQDANYTVRDKIYFSRKQFFDAKWKDFGESAVEEIFQKNGFTSVSPEKLTVKEQIFIWNTTKAIACVNGTLPMNIVFAMQPLNLIVLNKTSRPHQNLFKLQRIFKADYITYIDIYNQKYAHLVKHMGSGPFLMYNSPQLIAYCHQNGLQNNGEGLFAYPLKATLSIWRFKYFNYYIFLHKLKNIPNKLRSIFHK